MYHHIIEEGYDFDYFFDWQFPKLSIMFSGCFTEKGVEGFLIIFS